MTINGFEYNTEHSGRTIDSVIRAFKAYNLRTMVTLDCTMAAYACQTMKKTINVRLATRTKILWSLRGGLWNV